MRGAKSLTLSGIVLVVWPEQINALELVSDAQPELPKLELESETSMTEESLDQEQVDTEQLRVAKAEVKRLKELLASSESRVQQAEEENQRLIADVNKMK